MDNIDIYSWYSLTNAVNKLYPPRQFLLNLAFKSTEQHQTRTIVYGKQTDTDKLAQFVNPEENPLLVSKLGKTAKMFELPITREKKVWTSEELAKKKVVGQIFAGSASDIKSQSNKSVLTEIDRLKARVMRLREWMAAQALSNGAIDVSQDNISFNIDFGFVNGRNLVTKTGTDLWTDSSSKPLTQIRTNKRNLAKRGYAAKYLILGETAATAFINHADIIANNKRNGYDIGNISLQNKFTDFNNYLGRFMGVDVFEYNYNYTNNAGTSVPMVAKTKAIMIGVPTDMSIGASPFKLHFGPTYRISDSRQPLTITNEFYLQPLTNPAKTQLEWILEQCSLPVIHDADAVISSIVTS